MDNEFDENVVIGEETEENEIKTGIKESRYTWVISIFVLLVFLCVFLLFKNEDDNEILSNSPTQSTNQTTPEPSFKNVITERYLLAMDEYSSLIMKGEYDYYNDYARLEIYFDNITSQPLVLWTPKWMYYEKPYSAIFHKDECYVLTRGAYADYEEMMRTFRPSVKEPIYLWRLNELGDWEGVVLDFGIDTLEKCSYFNFETLIGSVSDKVVISLFDKYGKRINSIPIPRI